MLHTGILAILRQLSRSYISGPLPEWDTFARATQMIHLEPRQELTDTPGNLYVVVRGMTKLIGKARDGTPRVDEFFDGISVVAPDLRPHWADKKSAPFTLSSWRSQRWSIPATTLVAIEPATLLRIDYRVVEVLSARHATWGQLHTAFLWTYVDGLFQVLDNNKEKDAEVRYRELMGRSRSFARRVSQRDIASYLHITEAALSRIAKRVRDSGDAIPEPEQQDPDLPEPTGG